jgi:hypothetical protein
MGEWAVRNPDEWQPPEPDPDDPTTPRRGAVIGLIVIVALIVGGLLLAHVLDRNARFQDCVLAGRKDCDPP